MAKSTYLSGQPILCQLLSFSEGPKDSPGESIGPSDNPSDIPGHLVEESVLQHRSDRYYKTMTTYKQLVFLFYWSSNAV